MANIETIVLSDVITLEELECIFNNIQKLNCSYFAFIKSDGKPSLNYTELISLMNENNASTVLVQNRTKPLVITRESAFGTLAGTWPSIYDVVFSVESFKKVNITNYIISKIMNGNDYIASELCETLLILIAMFESVLIYPGNADYIDLTEKFNNLSESCIRGFADLYITLKESIDSRNTLLGFIHLSESCSSVLSELENYDSVSTKTYEKLERRFNNMIDETFGYSHFSKAIRVEMRKCIFMKQRNRIKDQLLDQHYLLTGEWLDLDNPQTFNDKINWLKLYDATPLKTLCADKYLVRQYVSERINDDNLLMPLLGVWDSPEEIDFDSLPDKFVLKANHGSGMNLIVRDKSSLNIKDIISLAHRWLEKDFSKDSFEFHYSDIPKKLLAEELIENDGRGLHDYKLYTFNGKVKLIHYVPGRQDGEVVERYYDLDWNPLPINYCNELDKNVIERPKQLDKMIEYSEILGADFAYVRVDFYLTNDGDVKFGELTFTPSSGNDVWRPYGVEKILGDMIDIDYLRHRFEL